jgi:hypothetical protein
MRLFVGIDSLTEKFALVGIGKLIVQLKKAKMRQFSLGNK